MYENGSKIQNAFMNCIELQYQWEQYDPYWFVRTVKYQDFAFSSSGNQFAERSFWLLSVIWLLKSILTIGFSLVKMDGYTVEYTSGFNNLLSDKLWTFFPLVLVRCENAL